MQKTYHKQTVVHGKKTIEFRLLQSNRKTLQIIVQPNRTVIVKAPIQSEIEIIKGRIKKRARWILKQIKYFQQFEPRTSTRHFVSGETHLYLGKRYRLKIAQGEKDSVKLTHGYFIITYKDAFAVEKARELLDQWYLNKARLQFVKSIDRCWKKFISSDIEKPTLMIRRMKKRWGSLSLKKIVVLNPNLIRVPRECIDYVVTHELCHLKHNNHGQNFYKLLTSVMPDWKKLKQKLELSLV